MEEEDKALEAEDIEIDATGSLVTEEDKFTTNANTNITMEDDIDISSIFDEGKENDNMNDNDIYDDILIDN